MHHQFNPREIMAAAPDAVALAMGEKLDRPHPLAADLTLRRIAYAFGSIVRKQSSIEPDMAVVARGLATSDFSKVLADGVAGVTISTYRNQAEHTAFTERLEVANFKPETLPALDADISLEPLGENAEIQRGTVMLTAGSARQASLMVFARAVLVSRETIINDAMGAISLVFAGLGASAARLEARLVAEELESNPILDDDAVTFHADHKNVVDGVLNGANFGQAMALLRTQPTSSGQRADLRAKHLVVGPDLEYTARQLVVDAGLDVVVSTLANLPDGRWYALADKTTSPTIATLNLRGAKSPLRIEQRRRPLNCDGVAVLVGADLGARVLSRTGIVRGGI